jgi:iron complex outermembrane receptor protein
MPSRTIRLPVRLRAAALACAALCAPLAQAQDAPTPATTFAIPAQPLDQALNLLARQAGLQLLAPPALVQGVPGRAVQGRLGVAAAAAQLLQGTGLAARVVGGTLVVEKAPASSSTALPTVTVTADAARETATGPVDGYLARRNATGTKTDTPLIETPQSISIVTAVQVEAQKAQSLADTLAYTAGVAVRESSRATESFVLRGFQADGQSGSLYRDGTKYSSNLYQGQQEPYGMERIELLRGAASVLYGNAAPGGIINTVSKRPTQETLRELNLELGSFHRKQVSADFGGRLSEDGDWSYRLTGLLRDSDSFVDHVQDNRTFLAPALTWRPSATTSLTVLAQYKETESKYIYALPAIGTVKPSNHGRLSRSTFIGEPGADRYQDQARSIGYLLEHAFSDQVRLRQNVRLDNAHVVYDYTYHYDLADADQRITNRGFDQSASRARAFTADTSLELKWGSGALRHTTLVGLDHTRQKERVARYDLALPAFDIFAPTYGATPVDPQESLYAAHRKLKRTGIYVQDQVKVADRWVALLGGRYDWTENATSPIVGDDVWTSEKNNAFTARAGLVYLADNGLAPFASFSQSFEPAAGLGRTGERFKPTEGEQFELGLRWQPPGSETLVSATVYQLTQQNVLTLDPVNIAYQVQTGEKRARGFEFEAKTRVARNLSVLAAYAFTSAKTTKSNTASEIGARSPFTPRHQASVWADYGLGELGLPGLTVGGGVRYVGSSTGFAFLNASVPAYTVFDAMVSYATGPWKLALNVSNLADRTYIANCTYGCFYGEARKAIVSASYRW